MDIKCPSRPDNAPKTAALAVPVPIAKFWKSARDHTKHVRVDLSEHKGLALVNVRIWQTGTDGIDRPTVQGVALIISKLPELARALAKAEAKARELGLLKAESSQ
jgi:hypothetical protein